MNMAEGAPPNKRPKTDGDVYMLLENSLPDELMSGDSSCLPANNGFPLNASQSLTQPAQISGSSVLSPHSVPNPPIPSAQSQRKLTQLLQSGHNSPKHAQTSSPINNNSPRPQQQHIQNPQPSPLGTAPNSLQSPSAGSMAVRNNMKSPPMSLPRPSSRPSSAMSATPSPRPMSIPGGPMSVGSIGTTVMSNPMRNSMVSGPIQQNIPNCHGMPMSSAGPLNQDKMNMTNGMNRLPQAQPNMGGNLQNDLVMQMSVGQMMNQHVGNYVAQSRIPAQVGQMHSMGSSMNSYGQQMPANMSAGPRQMAVSTGSFNDLSAVSRPAPGMMSQDGSRQNHLGDGLSMDGSMMLNDKTSDNMQMIQQPSGIGMMGMDKSSMQMQAMRPNMPLMQPGNMQHHPGQVQDVGMPPQETGQQQMQQPLQMGQNHPGVAQLQIQGSGQDQMGNMATKSQPGTATVSTPADPEKRRLIQQQLVLLLHAYKCSKKEHSGDTINCALPHCRTMKEVLRHMNVCTQGKSCQVAHCASSRQIIAHWRACNRHDCVVCLPLKSVPNNNNSAASTTSMQPRWPNPASQIGEPSMPIPRTTSNVLGVATGPPYPGNFNDPMLDPNSLQPRNTNPSEGLGNLPNGLNPNQVPGMMNRVGPDGGGNFFHPPRVEKEWHEDVKEDLRNHLILKLVQAIFPTPQKVSLTDERMKKLVTFARKVEGDMYDQANSRSEYYHLLAEKIYKIQKELEEKRALRMKGRVVGPRLTQNGPVPVNSLGSMAPGAMSGSVRMPMGGMQKRGTPMRFCSPMTNATTAQGKVMENMLANAPCMPMNPTTHAEYSDPVMMKFQKATDEIRHQRDNASPLVGSQHYSQANTMQDANSLSNSGSLCPETMGDGSRMMQGSADGMGGQGPSSSGQLDQVSQGGLELMSPNYGAKLPGQSAQPRLEKLLRETAPVSASTPVMTSNNFYVSDQQPGKNQSSQQMPFPSMTGSKPPQSQHPASLQEILQGSGSSSGATSSASSTATASFVPLSSLNASSSAAMMTSPTPFVSTPQVLSGGKPKDNNSASAVPGSYSGNKMIKVEGGKGGNATSDSAVTVKTEIQNDNGGGFGHRGKPWSSPGVSSRIKTEVKTEPEERFNTMPQAISTTVSTTSNHDPFVKQENMAVAESTVPQKGNIPHKVFDPLELKVALLPIVEKLFKQEPEALPFRQPVDPDKLNIPDYFDIVKTPMDLASIRKNLETGRYKEPWEFISDIWLMFNNAWLYNRRTTRVYKYCSKLKEVFDIEIDPVMQRLGYCCGRKMEFMPMTLCCYGKQLCTIPTGAVYYDYLSRYDYCEKCFNEIPGDAISLADDPSKPQASITTIQKSQFEKKKNDVLDPEPFEICNVCGRKMHKICVLHMSPIWPEGFTCDECHAKRGSQRKPNRYPAMKLPQIKLGEHIERRVNTYIKRHDSTGDAGHVHIRVVYSGDKTVEVRPGMKARFVDTKEMPETFPYRAKAFFAFEEIDGVDVCFFGVHVQEYGSDAPRPNQRRVYLSYLDSVHFFRPRHLRTAVYHEILIGYFEYCKNLGYEFAHIWACPPCEGDDYIFHCHPIEQKIPKPKRLQDWYKKMLDKAISEQVIVEYKDIFHQAKEDRLQVARELPYFEGDFWPNVLEESIKEIEQEEEERRQAEASEQAAADEALLFKFSPLQSDQGSSCNMKNGKNKKSKKANIKKTSQRTTKKKLPQVMNDLSDKLYQIMEKHKEVFFVIRLNSVETISKIGPTMDPDSPMQCDLMDGRDAFLTLAREKHYEFSSLRRAKWSTMAMLIELHTHGQDKFSYMCNRCRNNVETRYQCTVCHDFDLCINCYKTIGHEHKMDKMGFDLDDGTSGSPGSGSSNSKSSVPVERCMQSLVHASQCKNANCSMNACFKMKKVIHHAKNCKKKTNGTCMICKQLIALCYYHAKHCQEKKCPVAFCHNIKAKLKEQELQHRLRQAQLMKRRIEVMSRNTSAASGPHTPAASASNPLHNQSSPKIQSVTDGHMRKPQPSPMSMTHDGNQQQQQQMQAGQKSHMMNSQGMIVAQQPDNALTSPMMSPQQLGMNMNTNQQQHLNNPAVMMNQSQSQPMQQVNMQGHAMQPGFVRKYPSPPPEAAVRAAKHALQVADQQAKERERLDTFMHTSVPNTNRPVNTMPRMVTNNPGTSAWANPQMRQPVRPMMPGQPSQVIGGSPQLINTMSQPAGTNNQALRQVLDLLKTESSGGAGGPSGTKPKSSEQLMALLKTNPLLMNTIIRQRKQAQNKQAMQKQFMTPNNMQTSMGNMQQQTMVGGLQQGTLQNTMNQSGMNMQQVQQWQQQQQQQQRRIQPQHQQQGPYQPPAPPYQQAINQRVMRFQQRMPTQIRHQQMNPGMIMQQGMNPSITNMQQGLQNSLSHHPGMVGSKVVPASRPPSQPMQTGRPGIQQMQMPGRTTPLNQNQGSVPQHMVANLDQSYNTVSAQQTMMVGAFSHPTNQGTGFNTAGAPFQGNVNQSMGHLSNANPNQGNLDSYVKINDK